VNNRDLLSLPSLGAALIVLASILLTGCAPTEGAASVPDEPATQSGEAPREPALPEPCDESTRGKLSTVISGQALALTAGELQEAYGFASPTFRSSVPIEVFERIITDRYAMLLSFEAASFGRCESAGGSQALMSVIVTSTEFQPVGMLYYLVLEEGAWWVNGVDVPTSAVPNA